MDVFAKGFAGCYGVTLLHQLPVARGCKPQVVGKEGGPPQVICSMDAVDSIEDGDLVPGLLGSQVLDLSQNLVPVLHAEGHAVDIENGAHVFVHDGVTEFPGIELMSIRVSGIGLPAGKGTQGELGHLADLLLQAHPG